MKNKTPKKTEIFNVLRLTSSFGEVAKLKPSILPERAMKKLCEYENTGLTPKEVLRTKETIHNLLERIKKLEGW